MMHPIADSTSGDSLADAADDLRVTRTRALRGPNVWSLVPVIQAEFQLGRLARRVTGDLPDLHARVRRALPGMRRELDPATGALQVDDPAAWWGDLLVRITLELQRLAGAVSATGRVALADRADDRWTVAIGYDEEALAVEAVRQSARVVRDCLRGDDPGIEATVSALARLYERASPGPTTRLMIAAAQQRGIAVRRNSDDGAVQLGVGASQRRTHGSRTDGTSVIATAIASDSHRIRQTLARVGITVPAGDVAWSLEDAQEIAESIGFPLLLKPADATGRGGMPDRIGDAESLATAWPLASAMSRRVIVERFVEGHDYRVVVVDGRVVAVAQRAAIDCTDEIHPENRALCELAAGAVGLDVAGIDVRSADIAVPFRLNGGAVVGVTASPALRMHAHPDTGVPRDVAGAILAMLYPPGAPTTVPVIAVTGTNGKTTTTRLIAHLFRTWGRIVGFTTTDGVYLQDQLLMKGDLTGPFAANVILSHPRVEVAVLETARGGILKSGLGFDQCDVAVVMNVTADHLGLRGIHTVEQLAEVKAVLPGVVKSDGCAVLNGDDPLVLGMRERTRGRIALFSTKPAGSNAAVDAHRASGGIVAIVERDGDAEMLVIRHGDTRILIAASVDVPLTFGGLARFQVQNVLAASLAAWVQGVPPEQIRTGLLSFRPSAVLTPGRLNVVETTRGRVLLDYAHNAAAIRGLVEFVNAMPASRRMALLSAPGDRRDEDLREIGRLAASLDYVIFKEHDVYRRGRAPGVIAGIMADGLRATGFPDERIGIFVEEHDAVTYVKSVMQPGDVVIIVADDTDAVTAQLRELIPAR